MPPQRGVGPKFNAAQKIGARLARHGPAILADSDIVMVDEMSTDGSASIVTADADKGHSILFYFRTRRG
jgi:hypothetical protein